MNMRTLIGSIAALLMTVAGAKAQPYQIEDIASIDALSVAQIKPRSIVFNDRGSDEIAEAGGIFVRYEEWAKARPLQQQNLSLYPGYAEPDADFVIDGVKRHYREKLHIYVAQARFIVAKPAASFDLARFVSLPFAQQLDPAVKHRLVTSAEIARGKEPRHLHNQNPQRRWCEDRPTTICLHSAYKFEGRLPVGIALANKIREGGRQIADTLEFEGELTFVPAAEVDQRGLARLTGLATPSVGALEQSIFYINQVMQFGKLLAVAQQHPTDASKTVATVYMTLAVETNILTKRKEYAQVPILRNLVPAQVLAGKSSFNSGNSLSAGLPVYARNQIKAIAAFLERGT
jgi:hypothetical protein